ncbi:sigma-70 family RNA polymerase sigma factor [Aeoliella mucimassa]|uniref:RNA polymerase sigma factor SigX n=1 Tax=Aeoliella mucimassa TaxID=2527972 RepID=A0A518AW24_9BACT|nr:sigma-70 family RNA polymerase sigma factor [Aeoliella mucimassa]QDU58939.1 RNA polymerase sigma factor SigX [Aeoliella mucimassa]
MSTGGTDDNVVGRKDEAFVQLLVGEQLTLLNYITALLADPDAASNVLQETNLVLWRKADEFEPGTCFTAWAKKVAYWQVQAFIRDRARDRHCFSKELIDQLATQRRQERDETEAQVALRHCLKGVSQPNLEMLRLRYESGLTLAAIAQQLGKKVSAVKVRFMRIRQALQECIQDNLTEPS